MSKMLFTPKGTPTYALDSYRPKTHRLSFAPEEAATRSKLFAKRKRESQMFATGQASLAPPNTKGSSSTDLAMGFAYVRAGTLLTRCLPACLS